MKYDQLLLVVAEILYSTFNEAGNEAEMGHGRKCKFHAGVASVLL
jgi:hypothetical protein